MGIYELAVEGARVILFQIPPAARGEIFIIRRLPTFQDVANVIQ